MASARFVPPSQNTPDSGVCNAPKLIWLTVLQAGQAKVEGSHLVRAFLPHHLMVTSRRTRGRENRRVNCPFLRNPLLQ